MEWHKCTEFFSFFHMDSGDQILALVFAIPAYCHIGCFSSPYLIFIQNPPFFVNHIFSVSDSLMCSLSPLSEVQRNLEGGNKVEEVGH